MHFSSPHAWYYISCPSQPHWFVHLNDILQRVQIMKLLITEFSPASCYFPLLSQNIPLSTMLFSNTFNILYSSFDVNNQVSHLYKTKGIFIVLYTLIFTFLDNRQKDKRFSRKHSLNLFRSYFPHYLNCVSTHSDQWTEMSFIHDTFSMLRAAEDV
jgi:hypothetical protein